MRSLWLLFIACLSCRNPTASPAPKPEQPEASAHAAAPGPVPASAEAGPIRMAVLHEGELPPTFVMRGGPRGGQRLVFLHGMCGHGLGYAQAFQFSAARLGTLIAPQGDVSCGGVWSKWSADVSRLDQRIVDTFHELGHQDPIEDVIVIGMSQGATRAVDLVRRFPGRYSRLIAMAAPSSIPPGQLKSLRGAVMMAGERDRQDLMRSSARALQASGIPATFLLIPGASHGAMGPTPELTMAGALQFLGADRAP